MHLSRRAFCKVCGIIVYGNCHHILLFTNVLNAIGKSSLVTAVLRLVELDGGVVEIDGLDVSKLGLRKLRSSVAIIPQVHHIMSHLP